MMNILIIFIMFMIGNMIFVYNHKHLLIMLLSLEFIVLSIYMMLVLYLNYMEFEIYILMIFLVFSVCEGALGISILVSMIRSHGNDYFQSYNLLW
uniref:NADH dehydrogenase subunit 4L n=1 Tax=Mooreana trichoneura TaxID=2866486 RepID=UPI001EDE6E92|nr:NADH dehydrogenase subunit 4L [Mooreana trichoneura]UJV31554.1 NADH dehydrogenase subunit 4L [Mooreana trichoneura]